MVAFFKCKHLVLVTDDQTMHLEQMNLKNSEEADAEREEVGLGSYGKTRGGMRNIQRSPPPQHNVPNLSNDSFSSNSA